MDLAALAGLDALLKQHFPDDSTVGVRPYRCLRLGFFDEGVAASWYNDCRPDFRWLLDLPDWPPSIAGVPDWANQVVAALRAVDGSRTPATPPEAAAWGAFLSGRRWAYRPDPHAPFEVQRDPLRGWGYRPVNGHDTEDLAYGFSVRLAAYDPRWLDPVRVAPIVVRFDDASLTVVLNGRRLPALEPSRRPLFELLRYLHEIGRPAKETELRQKVPIITTRVDKYLKKVEESGDTPREYLDLIGSEKNGGSWWNGPPAGAAPSRS